MTTEAGKRLLSLHASCDAGDCTILGDIQHMVPAIEAEAVAAERARIAEAVRGLPTWEGCGDGGGGFTTASGEVVVGWSCNAPPSVSLAAVLALIEEKP